MLLVKHGVEKNTLANFKVLKMREVIGNEEIQKTDLIDKVKKTFSAMKIENKRKENVAVENNNKQEDDVLYGRQSRPQYRNQRFVRSESKPNYYREARSKSYDRGRSQSRGKTLFKPYNSDKKYWEKQSSSRTSEDKLDKLTKWFEEQYYSTQGYKKGA